MAKAAATFSDPNRVFPVFTPQIQGDPNQNLKFLPAISLKLCISDPMLVKPKCVSYIYFENCKQTGEKL